MTNFVIGRDNIAVTVFVPWDCENNCTFCTSKKEYEKYKYPGNMKLYVSNLESRMLRIMDVIEEFNKTDIKEFVFTGGEPLADLERLQRLIDKVGKDKKVFINTTFPCRGHAEARKIAEYINNEPKIKGISISRHRESFETDTKMFNNNILKDRWISLITKPVRINCVVNQDTDFETIIMRYEEAPDNVSINFRADYRKICNSSLLKGFDEPGFVKLSQIVPLRYLSGGGCDVCNTNVFEYRYPSNKRRIVLYHRGLQQSSIEFGDTVIVNDFIIKNSGKWYYDWDDKNENKEKLLKELQKEYIEARKKHVGKVLQTLIDNNDIAINIDMNKIDTDILVDIVRLIDSAIVEIEDNYFKWNGMYTEEEFKEIISSYARLRRLFESKDIKRIIALNTDEIRSIDIENATPGEVIEYLKKTKVVIKEKSEKKSKKVVKTTSETVAHKTKTNKSMTPDLTSISTKSYGSGASVSSVSRPTHIGMGCGGHYGC